jgi:cell division protein FtsX
MNAGTALAMATAAAAALAAIYPVAGLSRVPELTSRLVLPTVPRPQFGIRWTDLAVSPTMLHRRASGVLFDTLLGITAGLLVVACLTIISIGVTRAIARAEEIAIRRAVGASRRQIRRAVLSEGAILGLAAVAVGGSIGLAFTRTLAAAWPGSIGSIALSAIPLALLVLVSVILVSVALPLLGLKRRTVPPGPPGKPIELLIAAFQLGVSLTVLTGTTVLSRQADRLEQTAATVHSAGRVFDVSALGDEQENSQTYGVLLRNLQRDSGADLSLTSRGVIVGLGMADLGTTDCGDCVLGNQKFQFHPVMVGYHAVIADTFQAMGMKIVSGRGLTAADSWNAPRVAVVSRSLASAHFEKRGAVGRGIYIGEGLNNFYQVVGVVDDPPATAFGARIGAQYNVYLSVLQHPPATAELLVRSDDPARIGRVRMALLATPGLAVRDSAGASEASLPTAEMAPTRWFARVIALEGWIMLVVVVAGVFALMHLWVNSLRQELAIRRSVGASRPGVVGFVLARASGAVVGGAAFGMWLGIIVWGTMASVIPGMPSWEAGVALRYVPLLAGAAFAGALVPMLRLLREAPAETFARM